jgi:hypothetical protein
MKTRVYSWRVEDEVLTALKCQARESDTSVSDLLDGLVKEWLDGRLRAGEREQARTRRRLASVIGSISGDDPRRSEKVGETVRRRLAEKHGR